MDVNADDDIGDLIRRAAERATDSIPAQRPPAEFYERMGRTEGVPRRYAAYAIAAVAALIAVLFGVVRLQDSERPAVDVAAPSSTRPGTTSTGPEQQSLDAQIRADTAAAAALGITIGPIDNVAEIDANALPDLAPFVEEGELYGYVKPTELLSGRVPLTVYAPDGATIRGVFSADTGFTPTE